MSQFILCLGTLGSCTDIAAAATSASDLTSVLRSAQVQKPSVYIALKDEGEDADADDCVGMVWLCVSSKPYGDSPRAEPYAL